MLSRGKSGHRVSMKSYQKRRDLFKISNYDDISILMGYTE